MKAEHTPTETEAAMIDHIANLPPDALVVDVPQDVLDRIAADGALGAEELRRLGFVVNGDPDDALDRARAKGLEGSAAKRAAGYIVVQLGDRWWLARPTSETRSRFERLA